MLDARSLGLDKARVGTAGAYLIVENCYVFVVAPKHGGDSLAVIRLGGHCEANETAWECAAREVNEEADLNIHRSSPLGTYWVDRGWDDTDLQEIVWTQDTSEGAAPLLIGSDNRSHDHQIAVMYLARANESPTPSSEVRGLLLLRPNEIGWIVEHTVTLGQFLSSGGKAILEDGFDERKVLEPFFQLRALSAILKLSNGRALLR
jgi:hypothetical protein